MKNSRFTFNIPVELKKSKDAAGKTKMKLAGIASTPDEDADGEFLDPNGFDIQPFLKSGFVNYNHLASKDPSTIIGEPTSKTKVLKNKGLYIEAELYPDSDLAKKTYKLAEVLSKNKSGRKLQWSIEGKAIERDPLNEKRVLKASITGVALTLSPKNSNTYADIVKGNFEFEEDRESKDLKAEIYDQKKMIKSLENELNKYKKKAKTEKSEKSKDEESEEEVKKTMTTSSPSGRALQPESVDKKTKKLTKSDIISEIQAIIPDIVLEKAEIIYGILISNKMKKGKNKNTELPTKEEIKKAEEFLGIASDDKKDKKGKKIKKGKGASKGKEDIKKSKTDEPLKKGKKTKKGMKETMDKVKGGDKEKKEDDNYVYMKKSGSEGEYDRYVVKGGELEKSGDGVWVKDDAGKYNPKEANGGQTSTISTGLKKSFDDGFEKLEELQKKSNKNIGLLFKGMKEETSDLIKSLTERVEAVEQGFGSRKTVTNAQAIEKSFGGASTDDLIKGGEAKQLPNQLSISKDRAAVSNLIEKSMYEDLEKGASSSVFEKALTTFEVSGNVSQGVAKRLKLEKGIELVQ